LVQDDPTAGFYEHSNELLDSIKSGKFLGQLSRYQLLENSAACS
jgi:hypothetical protein